MDDRELLELAAKAAGAARVESGDLYVPNGEEGKSLFLLGWNPLEDDGDALRLAVKLRLMDIWFDSSIGDEEVVCRRRDTLPLFESLGSDPYAATRRAIVRAAAEIGRTAKGGG